MSNVFPSGPTGYWSGGLVLAPICPDLSDINHHLQATNTPVSFTNNSLGWTQYRRFLTEAIWSCSYAERLALAPELSAYANRQKKSKTMTYRKDSREFSSVDIKFGVCFKAEFLEPSVISAAVGPRETP